jgi:hypothetical protein
MGRRDQLVYREPKSLWRRLLPAFAVLVVLVMIATLYVVRNSDRARIGTNAQDTVDNGATETHSVYLDGWSVRTLAGQSLRFQAGMPGTTETTAPLPLTFRPLNRDELDDLVGTDPEIVENAFSRLVSGDDKMRCTSEGCRNSSGEVDLNLLTDLSTVPGLGSMYRAWNVDAGLYRATFEAPVDSPVSLSLENAGALTLFPAQTGRTVIGENGTEITLEIEPDAENGWGRRSWYVATAWGTVFLPEVRWNDGSPVIYTRDGGDAEPVAATTIAAADPTLFARGLGDVAPRSLAALTRSQLTYFSSPVTGCGVAALCVPGTADVQVTETSRQSAPVCSVDGEHAVLTAVTTDWKVTLTGQVHAFGAWNGKDPKEFPGATGSSVLGYRGAPELVGGQLDLRVNLWILVNGTGEMFALAGSRAQIGVDASEYTRAKATLADLNMFFGGDWSPCTNES